MSLFRSWYPGGALMAHNLIYWYKYEITAKVSVSGDFAITPTQEML